MLGTPKRESPLPGGPPCSGAILVLVGVSPNLSGKRPRLESQPLRLWFSCRWFSNKDVSSMTSKQRLSDFHSFCLHVVWGGTIFWKNIWQKCYSLGWVICGAYAVWNRMRVRETSMDSLSPAACAETSETFGFKTRAGFEESNLLLEKLISSGINSPSPFFVAYL